MTPSLIRELLERVRDDGVLPTSEEISAALPSTPSKSGRAWDRKELRMAAKRVRLLADETEGGDDQAAAVEEEIARAELKLDPTAPGRLADEIQARDSSSGGVERRRTAAQARRQTISGLVDTLKLSGPQGGISLDDIRRFRLRDDLTAQQREQFECDVLKAAKRVVDIHRSGAQQNARLVAQSAAEELGDYLAPHRHVDPMADVEDPRVLADAILARGRGA
jgi:hypothetical protein